MEQETEPGKDIAKKESLLPYTLSDTPPERIAEVIKLLKQGKTSTYVSKQLRMAEDTIASIVHAHAADVGTWQERRSKGLLQTLDKLQDHLDENIAELKVSATPVSIGIIVDKILLLQGQPTSISTVTHDRVDHAQTIDIISSLPDTHTLDAEVVPPLDNQGLT